ncbi:MAG: DeoR/GlpR family DNA-binding transcription regulator [Sporolactobacillus sp.]
MLQAERYKLILDILDTEGTVSVNKLAEALSCSTMTIRRDLKELDEQNKIVRLYGGAQKVNLQQKERTSKEKSALNIKEKEYIGKIMNALIEDRSVIYIGAGTTAYYALPSIKKEDLTIITNSLPSFIYLTKNTSYKLLLAGGSFNTTTEEFVGPVAERSFEGLNIDVAFAATNGIYNDNVTTSNPPQGSIQNIAFSHSKIKIIIADHTKFNTSDLFTFHKLSDLDYVITDSKLSDELLNYYSQFVRIITKGDDLHDTYNHSKSFS